jgi:tripartite-type tricarboxylate transporter receptor subunit TctC
LEQEEASLSGGRIRLGRSSMNLLRRSLATTLIAAALITSTMTIGWASQPYPTRPIKWIVAGSPGSQMDQTTRVIAKHLSDRLKTPVVVDNRAGASGFIAATALTSSQPDSYTLLSANSSVSVINYAALKELPYNPLTDFAPVAGIYKTGLILAVPASSPAKTLPELLDIIKEKAGKANVGSSTIGLEVVTSDLLQQAKTSATIIGYKSTVQTSMDLAAGLLDFAILDYASVVPLAQAGKLRLLAIVGDERMSSIPDVPTVAETGAIAGATSAPTSWAGIFVPANTPAEIIAVLSQNLIEIVHSPSVKEALAASSLTPFPVGPEGVRDYQVSNIKWWVDAMKAAEISKR